MTGFLERELGVLEMRAPGRLPGIHEFYNEVHDTATGRFGGAKGGTQKERAGRGKGRPAPKPPVRSDTLRNIGIGLGVAAVAVGLVYVAKKRGSGQTASKLSPEMEQYGGKLTGSHAVAVESYADTTLANGSYELNGGLRGLGPLSSRSVQTAHLLDDVIEHSPGLDRATVVYRGMPASAGNPVSKAIINGDAIGKTFKDKAFVSTTLDSGRATKFATELAQDAQGGDVIVMRLSVPAGTKGVYVQNRWQSHELIMGRGSAVRVTGVTTKNGIHYVDAEVTGFKPQQLKQFPGGTKPNFALGNGPMSWQKKAGLGAGIMTTTGGLTYAGTHAGRDSNGEANVRNVANKHVEDANSGRSNKTRKIAIGLAAVAIGAGLIYGSGKTRTLTGRASAETKDLHPGQRTFAARLQGPYRGSLQNYLNRAQAAEMNGMLRGTSVAGAARPRVEGQVRLLDDIVQHSPELRGPKRLFRGMPLDASNPLSADIISGKAVGRTVTDKGFMSTSFERGLPAKSMAKGKGPSAILVINAPKGTQGVYIQHAGQQSEFLLGRGGRIRVTKVTKLPDGNYEVHADLVDFKPSPLRSRRTRRPRFGLSGKPITEPWAGQRGAVTGAVTTTGGLTYVAVGAGGAAGVVSGDRLVRTPEGAERYGVPIGSPIPVAEAGLLSMVSLDHRAGRNDLLQKIAVGLGKTQLIGYEPNDLDKMIKLKIEKLSKKGG